MYKLYAAIVIRANKGTTAYSWIAYSGPSLLDLESKQKELRQRYNQIYFTVEETNE